VIPQQLNTFRSWFEEYVSRFYGDNEYINGNLKLKEDHSIRVCTEILYLADALKLGDNDRLIAETIALLHDIGRFKQFIEYQTYNDLKSTNHCCLGVETLRVAGILNKLPEDERRIIETAVKFHGVKTLPADIAEPALRFCKLIRDADKLDVFHIAVEYYKDYRNAPKSVMLELGFPDKPECSPDVVDAVMNEYSIDYGKLQTLNDMILCQLGWVYDINFAASVQRIRQQGYMETLISYLPRTDEVARVREKVFAYIDSRPKKDAC